MQLLAPLFLAGLTAIAVPILIHLTHKERREPVRFPSLMFVQRVPFRAQHRRRIRDWLLFLLRVSAIVMLCIAFARPLLRGTGVAAGGPGAARDLVLLIDRSFSMEYGDRWDRAISEARERVGGLGPSDRAAVVFFADRAEAMSRLVDDQTALRAVLDEARPEPAVTRYAPALRLARDLLAESDRPRRDLVLITDLQRAGWQADEDVRLPPGVGLEIVDVSEGEPSNLAIAEVRLERNRGDGGDAAARLAVNARVVNTGEEAISGVRARLEVDGTELRNASVSVPARDAAMVAFAPIPFPAQESRARVVITGDDLARDNVFHVVLRPAGQVPVLLVEASSAAEREGLYVRRALEIGTDPEFVVTERRGAPTERDLADRSVIVLNDGPFPSGAAGQRLRGLVEAGAGLLVVAGSRTEANALRARFPELVTGGTPEPVDRLRDGGGTLAILSYDHPVFEPFRAPGSGDFSSARFFRYRRLEVPRTATVLARFDDGAPALAEASVGNGRVAVLATELSSLWNDLPLQSVFLPFVHRVVRHLANYRAAPISQTAGQALDVASEPVAVRWGGPDLDPELIVEQPSGERTATPRSAARIELRETGFYTVRPATDAGAPSLVVAVNPDVSESQLTSLAEEEVRAAVAPLEGNAAAASLDQATLTPAELERRQGLWWYLLLAMLLILAAESLVGGRRLLSRSAPASR